jgi:methylphosphotriester-DNA--protein-cysteine methyltransferase
MLCLECSSALEYASRTGMRPTLPANEGYGAARSDLIRLTEALFASRAYRPCNRYLEAGLYQALAKHVLCVVALAVEHHHEDAVISQDLMKILGFTQTYDALTLKKRCGLNNIIFLPQLRIKIVNPFN